MCVCLSVCIALSCMRKNLEGKTGSFGESRWHAVLLLAITKRATSQTMYSFCNHSNTETDCDNSSYVLYTSTATNLFDTNTKVCSTDLQLCWLFYRFVFVGLSLFYFHLFMNRNKGMCTSLAFASSGHCASLVCLMFSTIFLRKAWLLFSFLVIRTSSMNHRHLHNTYIHTVNMLLYITELCPGCQGCHSLFDVFELFIFMWFCEVWVMGQQVDHIGNDILRKEGDKFFWREREKITTFNL